MSKDLITALEAIAYAAMDLTIDRRSLSTAARNAIARHRSSVESVEAVAWQARSKDNGTWGPPTTSRRVAESLASDGHEVRGLCVAEEIRSLIDAAVQREREECAKVCDARFMGDLNREDMEAKRCAAAIRARGEK